MAFVVTPELLKVYNRRQYVRRNPDAKTSVKASQASKTPSLRELEWAAGFLEGEGSFNFDKQCLGRGRVGANQVNKEPLEKLLTLFGGHIYTRMPSKNGIGKQQIHTWVVTGPRARGVMMTMYTLLSKRRQQQVKAALGYIERMG